MITVNIEADAISQDLEDLRESFKQLREYCDRLEFRLEEFEQRMVTEHLNAEDWRRKAHEAEDRQAYLTDRLLTFMRENRVGKPFPDFVPLWKHKKRGSSYDILAVCRAQVSGKPLMDDDRVVVYANKENMVFVRGFSEFMDGRFEWIG